MQRLKIFLSGLVILFLLFSCRKHDEKAEWATNNTAPLATVDLGLDKLIRDSVLVNNQANGLSLNYKTSALSLDFQKIAAFIPDTSIVTRQTITNLVVGKLSLTLNASLGFIATQMYNSTDPSQQFLGNYIISNNGNNIPITPINNLSMAPFQFDLSTYISQIEFNNAEVCFWLVNHLPIDITNVNYKLINPTNNVVVFSGFVPVIPSYDSVWVCHQLQNVSMNGTMKFQVVSFSTPGSSTPVRIDTNDFIRVWGGFSRLDVNQATIKFPSQDFELNNTEGTANIRDRKFTYLDVRTGELTVTIYSSIQEKMHLKYMLKGAYDKYGRALIKETDVGAAVVGQPTVISQTFNLDGYSIALTGADGSKFNTYTQILTAHIDSTGIERHISSADSLYIEYRLHNIQPNYIKGYAGRDTFKYTGTTAISFTDLFGNSQPNALQLQQIKLNLNLENGLGIDAKAIIRNLTGTNANAHSVSLQDFSPNPIVGNPLLIQRATDFPFTPAQNNYSLQSSTSNVNQFVGNIPNRLDYDIEIQTNPNGNTGQYNDFAYLESKLKLNLDLQVPLSLMANNLILRDTFPLSLAKSTKELNNILEGTLNLISYNKFPIEANVMLVLLDSNQVAIDTLINNGIVAAADLNTSCRAEQERKSIHSISIPAARMEKIKATRYAIIQSTFNTRSSNATCNGQFLKIFSDYKLRSTVGAQFIYKVKL